MENKITVDFKNIISELKDKELKLCFLKDVYGKTKDIFIEDSQRNLYQMEIYWQGSYLDKLIREGIIVEFNKIDDSLSQNIEDWQKEIWGILEVESFINRQSIYW